MTPASSSAASDGSPAFPTRWAVPPGADLRWRSWNDQMLVYHAPSGDTHLLNPLAAEALRSLAAAAASAAELTTHVAALFDLQADGGLLRQMEQCLIQFAELGLIEPANAAEGPFAA